MSVRLRGDASGSALVAAVMRARVQEGLGVYLRVTREEARREREWGPRSDIFSWEA